MLDLHFLGYGAAFYPVLGNTNAYFTTKNDLVFLDFGESAYEKVISRMNIAQYNQIWVLLTHLHADHCGSLASLISYTHCVLKREISVVHPLNTVNRLLTLQGIAPDFYHYYPALPGDAPFYAFPIEVPHARDMRSFGYLLRVENEAVYFSGDAADLPEDVVRQYLNGEIGRIYQDTASRPSSAHCPYTLLEKIIPPDHRKNVYCMHLDGDYADTLKMLGFSVVNAD